MGGFEIAWKRRYPKCNPIGYLMRQAGAPHWLRFHSLPLSKRYAETDDERGVLLARHNELAGEVLGMTERCWLVQTCWETPESVDGGGDDPFWACREYGLSSVFRFREDPDAEDEWQVHAASTSWTKGAFDKLLLDVANERAAPTLWMSASTGSVFAPYDGGVDLFLRSPSTVAELAARYAAWLSNRPDGL